MFTLLARDGPRCIFLKNYFWGCCSRINAGRFWTVQHANANLTGPSWNTKSLLQWLYKTLKKRVVMKRIGLFWTHLKPVFCFVVVTILAWHDIIKPHLFKNWVNKRYKQDWELFKHSVRLLQSFCLVVNQKVVPLFFYLEYILKKCIKVKILSLTTKTKKRIKKRSKNVYLSCKVRAFLKSMAADLFTKPRTWWTDLIKSQSKL